MQGFWLVQTVLTTSWHTKEILCGYRVDLWFEDSGLRCMGNELVRPLSGMCTHHTQPAQNAQTWCLYVPEQTANTAAAMQQAQEDSIVQKLVPRAISSTCPPTSTCHPGGVI